MILFPVNTPRFSYGFFCGETPLGTPGSRKHSVGTSMLGSTMALTRVTSIPSLCLGLLVLSPMLLTAPCPAAHDTPSSCPTFRQNQSRTGFLETGPKPPLKLAWKFKSKKHQWDIERSPADDGFSGAAIYGGKVYVGAHDGHVYALDASDGQVAWKFRTGGKISSTPAIMDDTLYVGSTDNHIYILEAQTGELITKFKSGKNLFKGVIWYGGIRGSPLVEGDKLFFGG